jgi:hypothetical protein
VLFVELKCLTCLRWGSSCSSPTRVRVLTGPSENRTGIFRVLIWISQIVVVSIVIDPIPLLKLPCSISSQVHKLFFSILLQRCRCFTWKVCLQDMNAWPTCQFRCKNMYANFGITSLEKKTRSYLYLSAG